MYKIVWLPIIVLLYSASSCNKCSYLECAVDNSSCEIKIVDKNNGANLVFGTNAVYDKTKFLFYTLSGNDTIKFVHSVNANYGVSNDSSFIVDFTPRRETPYYIKFSNNDIDTIKVTYITRNSKCCGTFNDINTILFNNTTNLPLVNNRVEIKK